MVTYYTDHYIVTRWVENQELVQHAPKKSLTATIMRAKQNLWKR